MIQFYSKWQKISCYRFFFKKLIWQKNFQNLSDLETFFFPFQVNSNWNWERSYSIWQEKLIKWHVTFALRTPMLWWRTNHHTGQREQISEQFPIPDSAAAQNPFHQHEQICIKVLWARKKLDADAFNISMNP